MHNKLPFALLNFLLIGFIWLHTPAGAYPFHKTDSPAPSEFLLDCSAFICCDAVILPGEAATLEITMTGIPPFTVFLFDGTQTQVLQSMFPFLLVPVSPPVTTTYTIPLMQDATGCSSPGEGFATIIVQGLNIYNVSGGGIGCPEDILPSSVMLDGSDMGVVYELYHESMPTGIVQPGTGGPLLFENIVLPGIYQVIAFDPGGTFTAMMAGSAMLLPYPSPIATIGGDVTVPPGTPVLLTVNFLAGLAPFTFTIAGNGFELSTFYGIDQNPFFIAVNPFETTFYTITAITDYMGCSSFQLPGGALVTVIEQVVVTWDTPLESQCEDDTEYELTGGLPPGGNYSGPGVSGTNFDASVAGPGLHTLIYTYSDPFGMVGSASQDIMVYPLPFVDILPVPPQCDNGPPVPLEGIPPGGTFSGPGVDNNMFHPQLTGPGNWEVQYTYIDQASGCMGSAVEEIMVNPSPQADILPVGPQCDNGPPVPLEGIPPGGTFSGPGVDNNLFHPQLTG
ncbi:MAG TPA: hypothetical protein P5531_14345, partial [Bacteroidales bacterium]|nr:hypothetical protein [Bacteroidales bacterium]